MTGKQILQRIAIAIVLFSVLSILFVLFFLGGRGRLGGVVGLLVNGVLAFFLIAEHSWARWVLLIRCGFGAIFSTVAFFSLSRLGIGVFSLIGFWLLIEVVFSVSLAVFLAFSKRVNEVFHPSSGF